MKKGNFTVIIALLMVAMTTLFQGCSESAKGCTDPTAESYDPNAEENDVSACVYARDKFVGEYEGDLECLGLLGPTINGMTTFSIDESSKGTEYVDITIQSNPVLRLEALVSGSLLSVNTFIPGVTINMAVFDITAEGDLNIDNTQTMIDGQLMITLKGIVSIPDNCNITGVKK